MPQNKKFYVRKTADKDLEVIFIYSVENFGMKRAEEYIYDIIAAFQNLADNFKQGRDCSHVRPNLYAWNVVSHVIFYKPTKDGVSIYRVLHKSMDYKKHMGSR
jgi:toxin ParE1/3/4